MSAGMYDSHSTVREWYGPVFGGTVNWREVVVAPVGYLIYLSGPDFAQCGNKGPG